MAEPRETNAANSFDTTKPLEKSGKKAVKQTKYVDLSPMLPGLREALVQALLNEDKQKAKDVENYYPKDWADPAKRKRLEAYKKDRNAALKKYSAGRDGDEEINKVWQKYSDVAGPYRHEEFSDKDWQTLVEARGRPRKHGAENEQDTGDSNPIMQLRKIINLRGLRDMEFADHSRAKIHPSDAQAALYKYGSMRRPDEKLAYIGQLGQNHKSFKKAVKS